MGGEGVDSAVICIGRMQFEPGHVFERLRLAAATVPAEAAEPKETSAATHHFSS